MSTSPSWSSRVLGSAALCGHRVRACRFGDAPKMLTHVNLSTNASCRTSPSSHLAIKRHMFNMLNMLSGPQDMIHKRSLTLYYTTYPFHYPLAHPFIQSLALLSHLSKHTEATEDANRNSFMYIVRPWSNPLQIVPVPVLSQHCQSRRPAILHLTCK